ncbi:MAG: hypothetical protein ACRDZP_01025 [Acidimicrobiales bacterium]
MTQSNGQLEPAETSPDSDAARAAPEEVSVAPRQLAGAARVPLETEVESAAAGWIDPFDQAWHLVRAMDWLVMIDPEASLEMRLAVMTHDIERMFPGGPSIDKATCRWDDPDYLYAHASRSADVVENWLGERSLASGLDMAELRRLITLHEFGGLDGADAVQAADSLSFLETLRGVVRSWVTSDECGVEQARAKHQYMADRIRLPAAGHLAGPLLEGALASLEDLVAVA